MPGYNRINFAFAAGLLLLTATPSFANTTYTGIASVYEGGLTANGEYAKVTDFTAAHRTLPFGTRVRVTNTKNGRSVVVRINDRGPFIKPPCSLRPWQLWCWAWAPEIGT